jgi:hypothetical protein
MNLRVLIYMNPLVVDKIAKKFIYDKDSGFIFTRNLIAELPEDWRYSILVPKGVPREFFPENRVVELLPYNYSTSIHQNRYHFNREMLADYFPYGKDVDVILCNQPEVSANLAAFFFNQRREKPIIINFYHWIDCKESRKFARDLGGYIWRQIDGALAADMNYFHTPYAHSLFENEWKELLIDDIKYKHDYFSVAPTIFGNTPIELPKKKIILFNHRNNATTGWQEVLEAGKKLREKRDDFVLWFTDDQKTDQNKMLEGLDFVIVKRVPFESYGYLMQNSHFSVCNVDGYATWNLSVLDSVANDCYPLIRNTDLLRSLVPNAIHFSSIDELVKIMDEFLDIPYLWDELRYWETPIHKSNVITSIKTALDARLRGKTPKKYELVRDFIEDAGCSVRKTEWVNKFWSFHANGNFQKIRWNLLYSGVCDDIQSSTTVYSL